MGSATDEGAAASGPGISIGSATDEGATAAGPATVESSAIIDETKSPQRQVGRPV